MSLPTLADLKLHLNINNATNDDELVDHLDAAVAMVEGLIGPITTITVTETHYGVAAPTLMLRRMPVSELLEITASAYSLYNYAGLTLTDYALDQSAGLVRLTAGGYFYGDVTVTYSVGREDLPADLRMAILIVAGHLWESQRGNTGGGPLAAETDSTFGLTPGAGFALPNRAKELLQSYVRSTGIA